MDKRLAVTYKDPSSPGFEISEVCGEDGVPRHVQAGALEVDVFGVISKKTDDYDDVVQCSSFLAKFRNYCTCKLGGLLAATVTTPALSCMSTNGTGQVAQ